MHIVMIAAENGALLGGKVGGIGDVIRDVPLALAQAGHRCTVITPGYSSLARLNSAIPVGTVTTRFCGRTEVLELLAVEPRPESSTGSAGTDHKGAGRGSRAGRKTSGTAKRSLVSHYVLEHPLFAAGGAGAIYCDDQQGPFATDAHKFALFCAATCEVLSGGGLGPIDVIHLHDWHAALVAILARIPAHQSLQNVPLVYSIHNLSLQGIRPLSGHESSFHHWFPDLVPDLRLVQDPRYWDCINLMRVGINLSDKVHAVSPSYAREILVPTDLTHGFIGGEGLEADLQRVSAQGRLVGILNGCDYSQPALAASSHGQLLELMERSLLSWVGERHMIPAAHFHAQRRIGQWRTRASLGRVLTSVGRITAQKSRLFTETVTAAVSAGVESSPGAAPQRCSALERLLDSLNEDVFIMVGNGEAELEAFFTDVMARRDNFLFLCGFSEALAAAIYASGDLFLMPSTFEPCGISQMLAMRAGMPCVVHHVGGLRDTVSHGENGFAFSGDTAREQAENMLAAVQEARALMEDKPAWERICQGARDSRFSWTKAVDEYLSQLYRH